jgi:hypothetical protein
MYVYDPVTEATDANLFSVLLIWALGNDKKTYNWYSRKGTKPWWGLQLKKGKIKVVNTFRYLGVALQMSVVSSEVNVQESSSGSKAIHDRRGNKTPLSGNRIAPV